MGEGPVLTQTEWMALEAEKLNHGSPDLERQVYGPLAATWWGAFKGHILSEHSESLQTVQPGGIEHVGTVVRAHRWIL